MNQDDPDETINLTTLGPCCICECAHGALNLVMLNKKAPTPGVGTWGCSECGLQMQGALAVLCMDCFRAFRDGKAQIKFACVGAPSAGMRVPVETLTEEFNHHRARHFIADKFSPN